MQPTYLIGCAGWTVPNVVRDEFPEAGTHLQRYAARFGAAEINSSFHRPHQLATYARWAAIVPDHFRFSVKIPKTITHSGRLAGDGTLLEDFLAGVAGLGPRLGCLLVQLPPSLAYDAVVANAFFTLLRTRFAGPVALEPRHASWFGVDPDALLTTHRVARVAADPASVPEAAETGGDGAIAYFRLHGSPRTYYSAYDDIYLDSLAARLRDAARRSRAVWCIFDNTVLGAATGNGLGLLARLG